MEREKIHLLIVVKIHLTMWAKRNKTGFKCSVRFTNDYGTYEHFFELVR